MIHFTDSAGADSVLNFSSSSGILIPKLSFSQSCSSSSSVSGDSSVGTNTCRVSSSCKIQFTFSIESYANLSIESGSCSYNLTDSKGIYSSTNGNLSANIVVDISNYDVLVLSKTISASGSGVGTHGSSASGSGSASITNLRMS